MNKYNKLYKKDDNVNWLKEISNRSYELRY